jgi:hypothetical protein
MSTAAEQVILDAIAIYNDTFGRGHGKEMTVTKFVSVFRMSEADAYELFDMVHNATETVESDDRV